MTALFSPGDLAGATTTVGAGMQDTYEVLREVDVPDGEGGTTTVEAVTSTGVCLLIALTAAAELEFAGRLGMSQPMRALLPVGADVQVKDALRVNGVREFTVRGVAVAAAFAVCTDVLLDEGM